MDCINFSLEGENLCDDHLSWAAKNYECTFCKRKFRSAQALGGHMNVHRRDRARLRLLPSTLSSECPHHSPNPNPNPYFTSSSSLSAPSKFLPHNYSSCQSLISPSLRTLVSTPSSYTDDHENNKKPKFELSPQISHVHNCNPKKGMRGVDEKILKGSFAQKDVDDEFNKVDLKEESNIIRQDMDLEMGLLKDFHKKEVDLELRLGHL